MGWHLESGVRSRFDLPATSRMINDRSDRLNGKGDELWNSSNRAWETHNRAGEKGTNCKGFIGYSLAVEESGTHKGTGGWAMRQLGRASIYLLHEQLPSLHWQLLNEESACALEGERNVEQRTRWRSWRCNRRHSWHIHSWPG